ncbi:hypothetical protein [Uliginosibacterium sp. 31-12]|uniref:hypothetical protein n=1 Tax=Uliginosibacterium sp. 31-12 TaxID=3062781 RepID=UPI0026E36C70|nr:hypothetical protein [Uliginosibacterium sp. 31-12]MDO6387475.1 hypothetical protein [Uliginosibacterium sp. 31-12]
MKKGIKMLNRAMLLITLLVLVGCGTIPAHVQAGRTAEVRSGDKTIFYMQISKEGRTHEELRQECRGVANVSRFTPGMNIVCTDADVSATSPWFFVSKEAKADPATTRWMFASEQGCLAVFAKVVEQGERIQSLCQLP